jgi:NTE family protein
MTTPITERTSQYQQIGLMLQGGGALGAYQVGVVKALTQAQIFPTWVCGVSIGAINGAIIVGNPPEKRLERLQEFWSIISTKPVWPWVSDSEVLRAWSNAASSWMTLTTGQPGFFKPRTANPWLWPAGSAQATSFYDSSALEKTLKRLVDFERLNSGEVRLSVGAVEIESGNNQFFDTGGVDHRGKPQILEVEHIMASGALPPALPMIKVGNKHYWDGGIVSNTPLQYMLDQSQDRSALIFQVDLFSARGTLPQTMPQVMARQKDITYSSRTRQATTSFKRMLKLRRQLAQALGRVPKDQLRPGEAQLMSDYLDAGVVNLVELIYKSKPYEIDTKDYEFSASSMKMHMETGELDTLNTLKHPEWLDKPSAAVGLIEHDIHRHPVEH